MRAFFTFREIREIRGKLLFAGRESAWRISAIFVSF
jgi:hypothetical protein